eukprot:TRINITY_DN2668_c0_g1_i1.p1 TRINITY_DN2668_c0_g1~~TRINITY_DN2668_c0_g1_i1.p1  ORF type:complete len:109 (-),score=15.97 TRINITY_DN2668_c0_g1_i1:166-492(-)
MTAAIQNFEVFDPFRSETEFNRSTWVHLRIQQRNGKKTLTTVQGLPEEVDLRKLLKAFKKDFCCNGVIVDDPELGQVLQLQGDHRAKISAFLIEEGIVSKNQIRRHGF